VASRYEAASGHELRRDCGYSAPLPSNPNQSLWLFCDMEEKDPASGALLQFRPGMFASVGPATPGQVPAPLSELPSPPAAVGALPSDRAPEPLLPLPTDLGCGAAPAYATTRPTGVTRGPTGRLKLRDGTAPVEISDGSQVLVITYVEACVAAPGSLEVHPKRFGIVAYDPAANQVRARFTLFAGTGGADLPWHQQLTSPVFDAAANPFNGNLSTGSLFLFASTCDTAVFVSCSAGRVFLARAPLIDAGNNGRLFQPAAYQYWAKSRAGWWDDPASSDTAVGIQRGWTDAAHAESILPAGTGAGPLEAEVGDLRWAARQADPVYRARGKGLVLVEQTNLAGGHRVWQASSPTAPWTLRSTASTACTVCGPITPHPDLSDPTQVLVSEYRHSDREVRVVPIGVPVDSAPPGAWVTSNRERAQMHDLRRECGWSAPLPSNPSESFWLFCDMAPIHNSAGEARLSLFFGTWAAVGPSTPERVPTSLSGVPAARCVGAAGCEAPPGTLPARPNNDDAGLFLRYPAGVCTAGSTPLNYAWGLTRGPAGPIQVDVTTAGGTVPTTYPDGSQLLFTVYSDLCITGEAGLAALHVKRTGVAVYDPATHTVLAQTTVHDPPGDADVPWQWVLSHPVFSGGQLYLFSGHCDTFIDPYGADPGQKCPAGTVAAVRVPEDDVQDPAQYRWHTGAAGGGTWVADHTVATSVVPATSPTRGPLGFGGTIYVGDFSGVGKGFLMIEPTSWLGHHRIWQATSPAGPWTLRRAEGAVMAGCEPDSAGQPRTTAACYNFGGHPELSSPDHLMVGHIQPDISTADDDTNQYEVEIVDIGGADIPSP
jgi:hypothetical protein